MSAADRLEDGYPHGTVPGYRGGCQGAVCPGTDLYGLTCRRAYQLSAGDYRYKRLVAEGKTPAEIAQILDPPATVPTPTKEKTMPTPNDVAKTTKPLTADPVEPEAEPRELEHALATLEADRTAENAAAEDGPPEQITTERWTAGLNPRQKAEKLREIREWARANGHQVPAKGKIPQAALAAYVRFEELIGRISVVADEEPPEPTPEDAAQPLAESANDPDPVSKPGEEPVTDEEAPAERTLDAEGEAMGHLSVPSDEGAEWSVCRVCGCSDWDCAQCIERTGAPCSWVESDLCSACVPQPLPPDEFAEAMEGARERADKDEFTGPDLDALIERIGARLDAGDLPAQDDHGRYVFSDRDLHLVDPPGRRPEWADVTVPEDIERLRALAVRLEQALAHAEAERDSARQALALTLQKWAEERMTVGALRLQRMLDDREVRRLRRLNQELSTVAETTQNHYNDVVAIARDAVRSPRRRWARRGRGA